MDHSLSISSIVGYDYFNGLNVVYPRPYCAQDVSLLLSVSWGKNYEMILVHHNF